MCVIKGTVVGFLLEAICFCSKQISSFESFRPWESISLRKRREDLLRLKSVRSSVSLIFYYQISVVWILLIKGIQSKRNVMLLIHFNRVETFGFLSSVEKWVLEHACYHVSMLGFVYHSNASSPLILSGYVHIGALKSFASALIRNFRCHWVSNFQHLNFLHWNVAFRASLSLAKDSKTCFIENVE